MLLTPEPNKADWFIPPTNCLLTLHYIATATWRLDNGSACILSYLSLTSCSSEDDRYWLAAVVVRLAQSNVTAYTSRLASWTIARLFFLFIWPDSHPNKRKKGVVHETTSQHALHATAMIVHYLQYSCRWCHNGNGTAIAITLQSYCGIYNS